MIIWLYKKRKLDDDVYDINEGFKKGDEVYVYHENEVDGGFIVYKKLVITDECVYDIVGLDEPIQIDIPYSLFYYTKADDMFVSLSDKEIAFIFDKESPTIAIQKDIREQFTDYINNNWHIETKKVEKRIEYLDKMLPERLDSQNPISIFNIFEKDKLTEISNTLKKGNPNYEWDRKYGSGGEIQQTLNRYIMFLDNTISVVEEAIQESTLVQDSNSQTLKSFFNKIDVHESAVISDAFKNIEFIIGQPNTGKSYNFEESQIFDTDYNEHYKYLKIPVSGGIGNEYKGLQNTDLAITYDPIKEEVRFGEFLQVLMSAIVNPKVPHVIFLDDFHNQDISSLLSEYTPLFKSQQMREIDDIDISHTIFTRIEYINSDDFIKTWNTFIDSHCKNIPIVPLTNRISGESLKLVFPSNFYLLGAANFNENTLNIFADWEDRAKITYKDPIETFTLENDLSGFVQCCKELNTNLRDILEKNKVFDYEKYCFGLWKIVKANGTAIDDLSKQKEIVRFFFGMIKNTLRFNNKNSSINSIGWELFINMQSNDWFIKNIKMIDGTVDNIDYKILHEYNIYEDEI